METLKSVARRVLRNKYSVVAEALTNTRLRKLEQRVDSLDRLEHRVDSLDRRVRLDLAAGIASTTYSDLVRARAIDLAHHELRIYSQNGEDGILLHLLASTGAPNRRLVEIGIGDGSECNSAHLLLNCGWSGVLMEADEAGAASARSMYHENNNVNVLSTLVTAENVNELMPRQPIDVLSIDVDGNDYWIWRAIKADANVVVIEYNASLGPETSLTIPYDPAFDYTTKSDHRLYHGASLTALARLGAERGMSLVGCDSQGVNAFFVRREYTGEHLPELTPTQAWRPIQKRLRRWSHSEQEQMLKDYEFVAIT